MKKKLICIICPRGCALEADISGSEVAVCGNACPKGKEYAINECTNPVRTVTATVRVSNRPGTMVSVKTQSPVPKDAMLEVIARLREIQVTAPLQIGDVVLENVFGTSIIVTKAVSEIG